MAVTTKELIRYSDSALEARFASADPATGKVLWSRTLPRSMTLLEIRSELKPTIGTETDILATIESGGLSKKGVNLFYLQNCALLVRWYGVGWYVGAYSVGGPRRWGAEHRVFSRK